MKIIIITIGLILSSINLSHAITNIDKAKGIILLIKGNPDNQKKFCSKSSFKKTIRSNSGNLCKDSFNAALALEGCSKGKNNSGKDIYFSGFEKSQCYDEAKKSVEITKSSNINIIASYLQDSCKTLSSIIPSLKDDCEDIITYIPDTKKSTASLPKDTYYKPTPECIALLQDYPTKTASRKLLIKSHPDTACNHLISQEKYISATGATLIKSTHLEGYDACKEEANKKSQLYSFCLKDEQPVKLED